MVGVPNSVHSLAFFLYKYLIFKLLIRLLNITPSLSNTLLLKTLIITLNLIINLFYIVILLYP
jgi:hypothetical protein